MASPSADSLRRDNCALAQVSLLIQEVYTEGGGAPHPCLVLSELGVHTTLRTGEREVLQGRKAWRGRGKLTPQLALEQFAAWRAASSGVWNKGPTSTSKPRSAKPVATTFAPRS